MVRKDASAARSAAAEPRDAAKIDRETAAMNEKIVETLHRVYTAKDTGLCDMGKLVGVDLLPPRKKISVLLVGNHSAGKSSFINWYVEETVQRTGVAIETNALTLVTSGKKREHLSGPATVQAFPHLKKLVDTAGLVDSISTEISTSRQKNFPMITFIDTPGLVDGDMRYAFDIDNALDWLGRAADLILVFFDPMGQALCKRTLDIVESLQQNSGADPEKISYYLSKADTVDRDTDRQRVLMQITENICTRPQLRGFGFDIKTIYLPTLYDDPVLAPCTNQMDELCQRIDKCIKTMVQTHMRNFERDCKQLEDTIKERIEQYRAKRQYRFTALQRTFAFGLLGLVPLMLLLIALITPLSTQPVLSEINEMHYGFISSVLGEDRITVRYGSTLLGLSLLLFLLARIFGSYTKVPSNKEIAKLEQALKDVRETYERNYGPLYQQYIGSAIDDKRL